MTSYVTARIRNRNLLLLGGFFAAPAAGLIALASLAPTAPTAQTAETLPPAQSLIKARQMSMTWTCERAVKKTLKDPGSYQYHNIVLTEAPPQDGHLVNGQLTFRAKNGFGGYDVGVALCGFNEGGDLVSGPYVI